jgi:predicted transcriptional regulator
MEATIIRVSKETKTLLDEWKIHPKESYNDVIRRLIDACTDNEPLSEEEIRGIEESLEDIKAGRVYPLEEVMDEIRVERGEGVQGTDDKPGKPGHKKAAARDSVAV